MDKKNILEQAAHSSGMTVPDGYFASFAARMQAELPEQPWEKEADESTVMPPSVWQRIRPFVYMAAMFAGIWLMMNMFSIFSPASPSAALESNPVLAEAIGNEQFVDEMTTDPDLLAYEEVDEMLDDMYAGGVPVDDLRQALFTEYNL